MGPGPEFSLPDRSGQSSYPRYDRDLQFPSALSASGDLPSQPDGNPYQTSQSPLVPDAGIGQAATQGNSHVEVAGGYSFRDAALRYAEKHENTPRHLLRLRRGETVVVPTSTSRGYTIYRAGKDDGDTYATDRTAADYDVEVFSDQFESTGLDHNRRVIVVQRRNPKNIIQGGRDSALGKGRTILDLASGRAPGWARYAADLYPGSTFWGTDTGYDQPADLQRDMPPGLYLSKDNWETLETVPDNSVDTFISEWGPLTHGNTRAVLQAMGRVARGAGSLLRYNLDIWDLTERGDKKEKALRDYGWEIVGYAPKCAVAVYKP